MPYRVISLLLLCVICSGFLSNSPALAKQSTNQTTQEPSQNNHQIFLPLVDAQQPQSSDTLIEAAQQRGEIDAETALIYQTFAVFGDPRLPAVYRGDGTVQGEIAATLEAEYQDLSEGAKETLAPFMLPPYHTGSWWDVRFGSSQERVSADANTWRCGQIGAEQFPRLHEWHYLDSTSGAVRIWWQDRYPEDAAKAKHLIGVVDDIWLRLTALMQRTPPLDNGDTTLCRGGSNQYDISIVDLMNAGEAHRYVQGSKASPSYLLLNRKAEESTLIHELMHAFEYAYDVAGEFDEYAWWREASAEWAVHYVRPTLNDEHRMNEYLFSQPREVLESRAFFHQYGANLFPLYLQLQTGSTDLVRQTFVQFGTNTNSLAAINKVIPGGFEKVWPKFAMQLLNHEPVNEFQKRDQVSGHVQFLADIEAELLGGQDFSYELDGEVKHLAAHPYRIVFKDAAIRSAVFINPLIEHPQAMAKIQALVKINGTWTEEDWTDLPARSFCRDVRSERVEELMIVISNHEWQNRSHTLSMPKAPFLNISNVACRGWEFEMTATETMTSSYHNYTEVTKTSGRWERNLVDSDPSDGRPFEFYQAKDIKANWQHTGTNGRCSGKGSGTVMLPGASQTWLAIWNTALDKTARQYVAGRRVYNGFGTDVEVFRNTTVTYTCPDTPAQTMYLNTIAHWFRTEIEPTQSVSADGKTITGTFTTTDDDGLDLKRVITYTWTMTALPPE